MPRPKKTNKDITPLGQELIEAAKEMLAYSRGEPGTEKFKSTTDTVPNKVNVKQIRTSMHLTQEQFAHFIGASVHAVRHWEKGRRTPDGTARTLLCVLQNNPRAVLDALGHPQA